jgi:O-antigen ligase
MTRTIKVAVWLLFIAGLLATGALGTETRLFLFWPGCALLGLAALAATLRWRWRMKTPPSDLCLASALLFAFYFVARQITSPVAAWSREDLFLLLACGVAYTLSATVLSHAKWRSGLVFALFVVLLGNLAVGFVHFSGRWTYHIVPGYMRSFGEGDAQRIGGFFNNPNHLGAFLAMMTLLALGLACFGRGQNLALRLLFFFLAIASALGITKTGSRGAMVGLGVGAAALVVMTLALLRWTRPHLFARAAAAIGVIGVISAVVLGAVMREQLQRRFAGAMPVGDPREFIWRSALAQHAEHPWLGAGARMFYEGCIRLRPEDAPAWMKDAQFAHSEWLQALSDYGWLGLGLVAVLFAVHLGNGWRFVRWFAFEQFPRTGSLGGTRLGLVVGAMAALMAALAHAFFEFHFHVPAVAVSAAALMGVLANPGADSPVWRPVRVPGVRLLGKLALLASGVALVWGAGVIGRADLLVERAKLAGKQDGTGRPDIVLLDRALALDPANAQTWHERGLALLDLAGGKPVHLAKPAVAKAAADLEHALRLNPFDPYPALALADADDVLGRFEDAERRLREAERAAPCYEAPRLALAIHFFRLQQWRRAEEAFLWTKEAKAGRTTDEWYDLYRQMLQVAMTR